MPPLRSILLVALSAASICHTQPQYASESAPEESAFESRTVDDWLDTVNSLPAESLRAAIEGHLKPKYREGIFSDEVDAIQAVRSDDPDLASKLVDLARHDAEIKDYLRKRQDTNTTTTSITPSSSSSSESSVPVSSSSTPVVVVTPSSSSSSQVPQSSTAVAPVSSSQEATITGVLVPVEISTTASDGSVVVQTTQAFESTAPTSVAVAITTTNAQGQAVTTSSMAAAILVTSTNAAGSTVVSASPISNVAVAPGGSVIENSSVQSLVTTTDSLGNSVVLTSPTRGATYTKTDAKGSVVVIVYTPTGGVVSALTLKTSTLPNGSIETITQFAQVGGATATAAPTSTHAGSASGTPGLQNGAAPIAGSRWFAAEISVLFSLAIGLAGVLL